MKKTLPEKITSFFFRNRNRFSRWVDDIYYNLKYTRKPAPIYKLVMKLQDEKSLPFKLLILPWKSLGNLFKKKPVKENLFKVIETTINRGMFSKMIPVTVFNVPISSMNQLHGLVDENDYIRKY